MLTTAPGSFRTVIWLICFAGAFLATHIPPPKTPLPHAPNDKLLHFVGFTVLGLLTLWQAAAGRSRLAPRAIVVRYLGLLAYAFLDERTQPLMGRSCEFGDWLADAGGAAAAVLIVLMFSTRGRLAEAKGR